MKLSRKALLPRPPKEDKPKQDKPAGEAPVAGAGQE